MYCTLKTDDRNENMSWAGVNVVGGVWGVWGVGTRHQHQLTVRRLSPAPARAWPVVCTGLSLLLHTPGGQVDIKI